MQNVNDHGHVIHNGKILTLIQQAFIDGLEGDEHYKAKAMDSDENEYMIRWEITAENWKEVEDESNMCDWDEFTVEVL